jgi:DNA-directed RNA polymerase subunit M/transcription elongation factor TFIIS
MKSQELRKLAIQMLEVRKIPVEYEEIVWKADVPYELTIRKLLRGVSLQEALGIIEVPDSVTRCKCGSYKVLERSMQTRSADESATSFYYCTTCKSHWKV